MAKKKPRPRRGPGRPGVDVEEQRRARLEARRQAKAAALAARRRRERRARIVRNVALLGLVGAAVWFFFLRSTTPTEINGNPITGFGSSGVNQHQEGTLEYDEVPPVSGAHGGQPSLCGIYGQVAPNADPTNALANERLVHALEHGTVAVYYSPELPADDVATIEGIAGEYDSHVLTAPYEGMDTLISVASWGERMDLDELDEDSIRDYIDAFREQGPEQPTPPCPMEVDQPYDPTATPTPEATTTPEPGDGGGGDGDGGGGGGGDGEGGRKGDKKGGDKKDNGDGDGN